MALTLPRKKRKIFFSECEMKNFKISLEQLKFFVLENKN